MKELWTRRGNNIIERFPELDRDMDALPDLVLDGELVIQTEEGLSDFEELARRNQMRSYKSIAYASMERPAAIFGFDLLELRGRDLRAEQLLVRKESLSKAVKKTARIKATSYVRDAGIDLFQAAEKHGAEGIVAKRADAPYPRGRSPNWVKIKTSHGRHTDVARAKWNE